MISRLTAFAATFSVAVAAAIAITAEAHAPVVAEPVAAAPAGVVRNVRIVELPRVVIVARRADRTAP